MTKQTNENFWDCECEKDYINPKSELLCDICGAHQDDMPDSRQNELENQFTEYKYQVGLLNTTLTDSLKKQALLQKQNKQISNELSSLKIAFKDQLNGKHVLINELNNAKNELIPQNKIIETIKQLRDEMKQNYLDAVSNEEYIRYRAQHMILNELLYKLPH